LNRLATAQNEKRAGTVGFALTILQRRLASSPEAIYQSLRRRRERLEKRLRELPQRGGAAPAAAIGGRLLDADDVEDLEDAPEDEVEAAILSYIRSPQPGAQTLRLDCASPTSSPRFAKHKQLLRCYTRMHRADVDRPLFAARCHPGVASGPSDARLSPQSRTTDP